MFASRPTAAGDGPLKWRKGIVQQVVSGSVQACLASTHLSLGKPMSIKVCTCSGLTSGSAGVLAIQWLMGEVENGLADSSNNLAGWLGWEVDGQVGQAKNAHERHEAFL